MRRPNSSLIAEPMRSGNELLAAASILAEWGSASSQQNTASKRPSDGVQRPVYFSPAKTHTIGSLSPVRAATGPSSRASYTPERFPYTMQRMDPPSRIEAADPTESDSWEQAAELAAAALKNADVVLESRMLDRMEQVEARERALAHDLARVLAADRALQVRSTAIEQLGEEVSAAAAMAKDAAAAAAASAASVRSGAATTALTHSPGNPETPALPRREQQQ